MTGTCGVYGVGDNALRVISQRITRTPQSKASLGFFYSLNTSIVNPRSGDRPKGRESSRRIQRLVGWRLPLALG
jgi:hypothetical protein